MSPVATLEVPVCVDTAYMKRLVLIVEWLLVHLPCRLAVFVANILLFTGHIRIKIANQRWEWVWMRVKVEYGSTS